MLFEFLYVDSAKSREGKNLSPKKLLASVENLDSGKNRGGEIVYSYRNADTCVDARFVAYDPEHDDEVGLAFEMELPRPTFFAYEALPAALCVAREKRLAVEILTDVGSVYYENPSFEEVLAEWRAANGRAVTKNGKPLQQGSAPNLESMWEFSIVRQDLARRYGRQRVEVPELYTVVHKKTKQVGRMVDWEGLDKVALGESDWIRLVNPPKPLVDGAIYLAEELTFACKPLVRTVPQPVFHYLCDKSKIATELVERIGALKKMTMRSFECLKFEQIFDEEGIPAKV